MIKLCDQYDDFDGEETTNYGTMNTSDEVRDVFHTSQPVKAKDHSRDKVDFSEMYSIFSLICPAKSRMDAAQNWTLSCNFHKSMPETAIASKTMTKLRSYS